MESNNKPKKAVVSGTDNYNTASIRNSPLAMPKTCQAQQDIYRLALEEEDREEQ